MPPLVRCCYCTFCQPPNTSSTVSRRTGAKSFAYFAATSLSNDEKDRWLLAWLQPFQHALPILLRAVEAVAVDFACNAWNFACRGELPERPGAWPVNHVGLCRYRAQPEMIIGKFALQHLAVKHGVCVDDRPLARISLHDVEQDFDLGKRGLAIDLPGAGLRMVVPFDVEHRRQRIGIGRNVQHEP